MPSLHENYVDEVEIEMEPLDENHLNLIGSDIEGEVFLTEEEQVSFSSNQNETNYEDPEDLEIGLLKTIMEVHM